MRFVPAVFFCLLAAVPLATSAAIAAAMPAAASADYQGELKAIEQRWTEIEYVTEGREAKRAQMAELAPRAAALAQRYPDRVEALFWDGLVRATQAELIGAGFDALRLAEEARDLWLKAEAMQPDALGGALHVSLGAMYYKVPGWPIAFGDDMQARQHLQRALALDPDNIDANYFYGQFLYEQGQYGEALRVLRHAAEAPPRPGHELADAGRRQDIESMLKKARRKAR